MGELFQQAEAWLDRIEQTQDYTLPYVDIESKTEPVRLNLMMSFWFYHGETLEIREYIFKKVLANEKSLCIFALGFRVRKPMSFKKDFYL